MWRKFGTHLTGRYIFPGIVFIFIQRVFDARKPVFQYWFAARILACRLLARVRKNRQNILQTTLVDDILYIRCYIPLKNYSKFEFFNPQKPSILGHFASFYEANF
jgi:hypothetical protein